MPFEYHPHPRTMAIREHRVAPPMTADQRTGFNGRVGLFITTVVGTMWCAYAFSVIAFYGLPTAAKAGGTALVLWVSSEFLQLVLLPIIIVGQNIQARASDKRAESTFKDAEAVLHESLQIQAHLIEQDKQIDLIAARTAS